jgi:hypothetical protein
MSYNSSPMSSLFYVFFVFIEPFLALNGAILAIFSPKAFLDSVLPLSTSKAPEAETTPFLRYLLVYIGSLYLFVAYLKVVLLRNQSDTRIWRIVVVGLILSDLGHLGAIQILLPGFEIYWNVPLWRVEDWCNIGILLLAFAMRILYLLCVVDWRDGKCKIRHAETAKIGTVPEPDSLINE